MRWKIVPVEYTVYFTALFSLQQTDGGTLRVTPNSLAFCDFPEDGVSEHRERAESGDRYGERSHLILGEIIQSAKEIAKE